MRKLLLLPVVLICLSTNAQKVVNRTMPKTTVDGDKGFGQWRVDTTYLLPITTHITTHIDDDTSTQTLDSTIMVMWNNKPIYRYKGTVVDTSYGAVSFYKQVEGYWGPIQLLTREARQIRTIRYTYFSQEMDYAVSYKTTVDDKVVWVPLDMTKHYEFIPYSKFQIVGY